MSPSHHGKHERVFTNRGRAIQTTITSRNLPPEYQIFTLLDTVSKSDLYKIIVYSPLININKNRLRWSDNNNALPISRNLSTEYQIYINVKKQRNVKQLKFPQMESKFSIWPTFYQPPGQTIDTQPKNDMKKTIWNHLSINTFSSGVWSYRGGQNKHGRNIY